METSKRSIVAFIDILGFKELVQENEQQKDNGIFKALVDNIEQACNKSILLVKASLEEIGKIDDINLIENFHYKVFSDNLFISYDYEDEETDYFFAVYWITTMALFYQREMLAKNLYVRGGIAEGQNYSSEHIIFSNALIKAYELESKIAKYPRIVIEKNIIEGLIRNFKEDICQSGMRDFFVKDWSGLVFINPFKLAESLQHLPIDPEVIPMINNVGEKFKEKEYGPDISDYDLIEIVMKDVQEKLQLKENTFDVYEKYLWLSKFIDWNYTDSSNLGFENICKKRKK